MTKLIVALAIVVLISIPAVASLTFVTLTYFFG